MAQYIYDNTFCLLESGKIITTAVFRFSNISVYNSFIHIDQHVYDPNINHRLKHMQLLFSKDILYNSAHPNDIITQSSRLTASFLTATHSSSILLNTIAGGTITANNLLITNIDIVGKIAGQYLGVIPTMIQNGYNIYNIVDAHTQFEQCFLKNYYLAQQSNQSRHALLLHEEIYKYILEAIDNVPNIEDVKNTRIVIKGGMVDDKIRYDAFTFKNNQDMQNIIINNNLSFLNKNYIDLGFSKL